MVTVVIEGVWPKYRPKYNYNLIIKTKWNYFNQKLFTTEEEAPSKLGLGL